MSAVAVERQLDAMDRIFLEKAEPQVAILMHQEIIVVQTDVDQMIGSEHDPAADRMRQAVAALDDVLCVVDNEVVARHGIHMSVVLEEAPQDEQIVAADIVVGVDTDDELSTRRLDRTVEAARQTELPLV